MPVCLIVILHITVDHMIPKTWGASFDFVMSRMHEREDQRAL